MAEKKKSSKADETLQPLDERKDENKALDFYNSLARKGRKIEDSEIPDGFFVMTIEEEDFLIKLPDEDTYAFMQSIGLTTDADSVENVQGVIEALVGINNWPRIQKIIQVEARKAMREREIWKVTGVGDEPRTVADVNAMFLDQITQIVEDMSTPKE